MTTSSGVTEKVIRVIEVHEVGVPFVGTGVVLPVIMAIAVTAGEEMDQV